MIDWRDWHHEPFCVGCLIFIGWLYALLAGPLRGRLAPSEAFPRAAAIRFYSALGLFYLAVGSPLDQAGGAYLFCARTAQHLTIMYPVAALLLLGLPGWMIDPLLARPALRRPLGPLRHPVVCGALFTLIVTAWHLPRLCELALEDGFVNGVETATFLAVSLLFWWPLISPSRVFPSLGHGGRMLYLCCLEVSLTAIFSYILMADHALYPTYQYAPRLLPGLAAVDDQLLGGVLLSVVSSGVMVGLLGVTFVRWARADKRS